MTIKTLPTIERPYERLETYGPEALSSSELLAIILKTGTKDKSVLDLAHSILMQHDLGLNALHLLSLDELKTISGIGRVKAVQLKAVAELAIRLSKSQVDRNVQVSSPSFLANRYMEEMRHLQQEHLKLVCLDTKNHIKKTITLSIGTVNSALIHPREVMIQCLKHQCVQLVVVHNHPSGDPTPSQDDRLVTKRLKYACDLIGITLLDHIIIGDHKYFSFKEEGYLDEA